MQTRANGQSGHQQDQQDHSLLTSLKYDVLSLYAKFESLASSSLSLIMVLQDPYNKQHSSCQSAQISKTSVKNLYDKI